MCSVSLTFYQCLISDSDGDELWYDDGALPYETEKVEKAFDMEREWQRRREQFHTVSLF